MATGESAPTALDVMFEYMRLEGVTHVFGVPGGLLYPFFARIENGGEFTFIVTKHEQGAAFMADGFARASEGLAVCAVTGGPGATNLLTAVACACADGIPMVVITGQPATHTLGRGAAQETGREDMDIVAMFRPITKYSAMLPNGQSMGHHVRRAFRLARTGRPGPVHLNIPMDVWHQSADVTWESSDSYRPPTNSVDTAALSRAAEELASAKSPLILVGSGASSPRTRALLISVAELLDAKVATTPKAKGLFPEHHGASLGVLGVGGHERARDEFFANRASVLLAVGTSLGETSTFGWNPAVAGRERRLIQIDIDPDHIGRNYPVDIPIVGDATACLERLGMLLLRAREASGIMSHLSTMPPPRVIDEREYSASSPVTPQRWRRDLENVLEDDAMIFSDIGGHMLFNLNNLRLSNGQRFYLNLGFGSMGHGTVAPIGAALANPGRPIVAIVGDACFTMNGMELLTAREYDVPVIWIVENNQMHSITRFASASLHPSGDHFKSIVYKKPLDVAGIASAMGLHAEKVAEPGEIIDAYREARRLGGPALIEVLVDPTIAPPMGARANALAGFMKSK